MPALLTSTSMCGHSRRISLAASRMLSNDSKSATTVSTSDAPAARTASAARSSFSALRPTSTIR